MPPSRWWPKKGARTLPARTAVHPCTGISGDSPTVSAAGASLDLRAAGSPYLGQS